MNRARFQRVFAALPVPEEFAGGIFDSVDTVLSSHGELRRTALENMHVTLLFLGEVEKEASDLLCAATVEAAANCAPVPVRAGRLIALPKGRPHVLAVTLEEEGAGGRLLRVSQALRGAFFSASRESGCPAPLPAARLLPHVSAARTRGREVVRLTGGEWETPIDASGILDTLTVFASDLRPEGARYTALAEARFGSSAD